MITTLVSDLSRVLLFPRDETYAGSLNDLDRKLIEDFGEGYKFFDYFKLNEELIEVYRDLMQKYPIYIFTTDAIQNRPEVQMAITPIVKEIFSVKSLNLNKTKPDAYIYLTQTLKKQPQEFLYIDDKAENISAAKQTGMNVLHYLNNIDTKKILNLLLLVQ